MMIIGTPSDDTTTPQNLVNVTTSQTPPIQEIAQLLAPPAPQINSGILLLEYLRQGCQGYHRLYAIS